MARIPIEIGVQEIITAAAQMSSSEINSLRKQLNELWEKKKQDPADNEKKLLEQKVKSRISDTEIEEYESYVDKPDITDAERQRSLDLFLKIQKDYARRIQVAAQIAETENVPLQTIIARYGLLNKKNV